MATILNLFFAILFLALIGQGHCQQCSDEIKVATNQTGKLVENKPEWQLTITNDCACSLSELKLRCDGFQTVEAIDPSVLAKSGGECLVNNGQPVPPSGVISFKYAWDIWFPFTVLSFQPNCS